MMTIDREVATELMGWTISDLGERPHSGNYHWIKPNTESDSPRFVTAYGNSFYPSTNISDAWLVVEKMRVLGWSITLRENTDASRPIPRNAIPEWWCMFWRGQYIKIEAEAETAPRAISKAALSALNGEKVYE